MNTLQAGFSRCNITPPLGCGMVGYYRKRQAEGVLDKLETNCLCLACGDTKIALVSVDNLGIEFAILNAIRQEASKITGLSAEAIYIHATHTHTGPFVTLNSENPLDHEYYQLFFHKVIDSVVLALQDLQPASMGYSVSHAHDIAFIRRFRMKDGSVQTNPGRNNPDILEPVGHVDERVNVLRFDREFDSIVLVNFGNHPDSVGGSKISADWPGFVRRYTEQAIPGTKCLFFTGVQGDVNHVDVHPKEWETPKGYDYNNARRMGRVVTGSVLQVYDKVRYVDVDKLNYIQKIVKAPSNRPNPEDMPKAHRISDLHTSGQKQLLPHRGSMLQTTVVAEAARMVKLEHGPDFIEIPLCAIAIASIAFIGIPGEPFSGIGFALKNTDDWDMVLPTCNTNGKEGYFPMLDAYAEGGYEARSSCFKAGIAELLIKEGKQLLRDLKQ